MNSSALKSAAVVDAIYNNLPLNISPTTLSTLEAIRSEVNPNAPKWPEQLNQDFLILAEMREEIERKEQQMATFQKRFNFLGRDGKQLRSLRLEVSILRALEKDTEEKMRFCRLQQKAAEEAVEHSSEGVVNLDALQARRQRRRCENAYSDLKFRLMELNRKNAQLRVKREYLQDAKELYETMQARLENMYTAYEGFLNELEAKIQRNDFTEEKKSKGFVLLENRLYDYDNTGIGESYGRWGEGEEDF